LVYRDFIKKLNAIVLDKLLKLKKEGKATESDLLKFAKFATGR
jgi:hypothetical protein